MDQEGWSWAGAHPEDRKKNEQRSGADFSLILVLINYFKVSKY